MKKGFILFLVLSAVLSVFAQKNDLVVFSEKGEEFILYVNSIKQNDMPAANVKAKDINGENFMVRIVFNDKSIPELTKTIWTESTNVEISAMIVYKKDKYVLRPMGETPKSSSPQIIKDQSIGYEDPGEPSNSNTGSHVNVTTTTMTKENEPRNEQISSERIVINTELKETGTKVSTTTGGESISMNVNINDNGMNVSGSDEYGNIDISFSLGDPIVQTSSTTITTTTITTTTTGSETIYSEPVDEVFVPVSNVSSRCSYPMSDLDFKDASSSIKAKSFEDSKLTSAKQICKASCLTAEQVRDINKLFSFEETRLEFAKYAYDYVYDASKYYKVNDSFEFELTIDELNEYLETK
ncbi:MAG TPA: DUF4476 domain-containing protein [Bacteroidales bacterium]|nr:DUF4476 domain-containing protein [Bacteroidales bacterium]